MYVNGEAVVLTLLLPRIPEQETSGLQVLDFMFQPSVNVRFSFDKLALFNSYKLFYSIKMPLYQQACKACFEEG